MVLFGSCYLTLIKYADLQKEGALTSGDEVIVISSTPTKVFTPVKR